MEGEITHAEYVLIMYVCVSWTNKCAEYKQKIADGSWPQEDLQSAGEELLKKNCRC
jgi:hypothetical protein